MEGKARSESTVSTDGTVIKSYAMTICVRVGGIAVLASDGPTMTTKMHLSSLRSLLKYDYVQLPAQYVKMIAEDHPSYTVRFPVAKLKELDAIVKQYHNDADWGCAAYLVLKDFCEIHNILCLWADPSKTKHRKPRPQYDSVCLGSDDTDLATYTGP